MMKEEQRMYDEGRTENLMKTLLKSGDIEERFEIIIESCRKNNLKYSDPEFYPHIPIPTEDKELLQDHEWKRIENQYPTDLFTNITPESIRQGSFGDCYFVVSFIYAAQNLEKVKYLFHPKSSLEYGAVLVYFHFLGERIPVIIDTLIAYDAKNGNFPLFSHPKNRSCSCWFSLVEKAFAKACGGIKYIVSGQTHFGIHVLFDYFSVAHSNLDDLIADAMIDEKDEIDKKEEVFKVLLNLRRKNAIIGTNIFMESFQNKTKEEIEQTTGLIPDHAYYVMDVREVDDKRFVKLRNPWGKIEWKGEFSANSEKWTDLLKEELKYSKSQDGSFWMLYNDFFFYFTSIGYSLEKEKGWKEVNVYGKIDGYLDGRLPFAFCKNTGCVPQWSIKFTRKTVVRLTFNIAGPISYHGLYLCKSHGQKVDLIKKNVEFEHSTTDTFVNGIEYEVEDFSEPYTFFLTRHECREKPCYYRILVESPDVDFVVNKFEDNFLNMKWNCVSESGIFTSPENDQWNPFGSKPLSTCRQWFIKFPHLKKNDETELRIRFFKSHSEGPLFLFVAKTDEKISYAYKKLEYYNLIANSVTEYEEYRIPIKNSNIENQKKNSKREAPCQYVISVYRNKQNDINKFKFILMSRSEFEFGLMPDPDYANNCGYTIEGCLRPGSNDGKNPYWTNVRDLKQWCLLFKKSPTNIFIDFYLKNATSLHSVYLELRNHLGQKICQFHKRFPHFDFDIKSNCSHNRKMWTIEDTSKPYALYVCREASSMVSEYRIDILGDECFQMFEIKDGERVGESAQRFVNKISNVQQDHKIEFKDVDFVEQPINFTPKKSGKCLVKEEEFLSIPKLMKYPASVQKETIFTDQLKNSIPIDKENLVSNKEKNSHLYQNLMPSLATHKKKVENSNINIKQNIPEKTELLSNNNSSIMYDHKKKEKQNKYQSKCCLLI